VIDPETDTAITVNGNSVTDTFILKQMDTHIVMTSKQILELYMCLGGVARYLSYLERGNSAAQMVGELCFSFNAPLIAEFHKLYRSLLEVIRKEKEILFERQKPFLYAMDEFQNYTNFSLK
jgi:hypothetical protein